jgi:hypothetical protein
MSITAPKARSAVTLAVTEVLCADGEWHCGSIVKQLNGHCRYQLLYDNGEVEDVVLKPEEDGKVWRHKEAYTNTNNGKRVYSEGNCHIADDKLLLLKGVPIIPQKLWKAVSKCGGIECVRSDRMWQQVREMLKLEAATSSGSQLNRAYDQYFGQQSMDKAKQNSKIRTPPSSPVLKGRNSMVSPTMTPNGRSFVYGPNSLTKKNKNSAKRILTLCGHPINPSELLSVVNQQGGVGTVRRKRLWQKIRAILNLTNTTSSGAQLNKAFYHYFEDGVLGSGNHPPSHGVGRSPKRKSSTFSIPTLSQFHPKAALSPKKQQRKKQKIELQTFNFSLSPPSEGKEEGFDTDVEYCENLDTIAKCIRNWVDCDEEEKESNGIEEQLSKAVHTCDIAELNYLQEALEEEYGRINQMIEDVGSERMHLCNGLNYVY